MAELTPEHYAVNQRWILSAADGQWEALIVEYLETIARRCHETGTCVIGHIKALALFSDGGYLRVSIVSPTLPAGVEGHVPAGCAELVLTLNVIIYGLTRDLLEKIATETAAHLIDKWKGKVTIEPV
jgi:hypothetical protein